MVVRSFVFKLLFCLWGVSLFAATGMAANIQVQVDRDPVRLDESFDVTFQAAGSVDADPDFGPLQQDFEVLSQSRNSNMQITNGQFSRKEVWTVTLMAKHAGALAIPSVAFGKDRSPELKLTVQAAAQDQLGQGSGDLFLEVEVEPRKTVVQAQVIYAIRLFRAVNLVNGQLTEPKLSQGDAVVEKLGDDSTYETRRDGRRYVVLERRYAIFPQLSGHVTIDSIVFEGRYVDRAGALRLTRVSSESLGIDVDAVPLGMQGTLWLPSRQVKLDETWPKDPPRFKVGEPVTRTLTLRADGLTAAQLPKISRGTAEGFKQYPDQPVLNDQKQGTGIVGSRQEKIAMIPTKPGSYTLPAIAIPWWNTEAGREEVARIPARTINVLPAVDAAGAPHGQPDAAQTTPNTIPVQFEGATKLPAQQTSYNVWLWVSLFLALGWLATAVAWRLSGRKSVNRKAGRAPVGTSNATRTERRLKEACLNNDPHETKAALLEWGARRWPEDPPVSLSDLAGRGSDALRSQVDALNQVLYGPRHQVWSGQALWKAIEDDKSGRRKQDTTRAEALSPLYP
jgi:hypothetical protein